MESRKEMEQQLKRDADSIVKRLIESSKMYSTFLEGEERERYKLWLLTQVMLQLKEYVLDECANKLDKAASRGVGGRSD